jgi:hypothetical protein
MILVLIFPAPKLRLHHPGFDFAYGKTLPA